MALIDNPYQIELPLSPEGDSMSDSSYHFFSSSQDAVLAQLDKAFLLEILGQMLLIRHFEQRGEAAYQQGKVGGFYHSYVGQEAIQTGCLAACGNQHWFTTTYRCHALALLLGATPNELMAELYGRSTGIAKGLGGSMHMYADRMLGGLAIVGGHIPIATGAAFTIKYLKQKDLASFCFLGEGASVQGAFHESINLAALWDLPCVYVIENNQWGMGTSATRAVCVKPIAEHFAKAYGIKSYTLDGMDFFNCYSGFKEAMRETLTTSRPVLIEAVTERFRGHSISDPALYRSKEALKKMMENDPIQYFTKVLFEQGIATEEEYEVLDQAMKEKVIAAMKFAEESPWPDPITLEEGVFAPEEKW
ncbi:MAG TPA: pyruvate dehydrogenase (acetyl-transferring) E1 component subunit alpha [Chlamydiales bacterium]|nr:pyruvate dehydrogenase (acetyl-transferring) E1 component subunit alpha [Chlamydiales bacterium]